MSRLVVFDIAKALCIVLVVIGHYYPENSPLWYQYVNRFIYSFHMPLFMFASGYIYIATKKEESYRGFLWKKVRRLMIPYFITSFVIITIKLITQGNAYIQNPVTIWAYLKCFYLPEAGYFLWFIWALWWMFVILPLFKTRFSRAALFICGAIFAYLPFSLTEMFCLIEFKRMFVYFLLGVLAFDYRDYFGKFIHTSSLLIYIVFVGCEFVYLSRIDELKYILVIIPYVGIAVIMHISRTLEDFIEGSLGKIIIPIASSSYIIYLFISYDI